MGCAVLEKVIRNFARKGGRILPKAGQIGKVSLLVCPPPEKPRWKRRAPGACAPGHGNNSVQGSGCRMNKICTASWSRDRAGLCGACAVMGAYAENKVSLLWI